MTGAFRARFAAMGCTRMHGCLKCFQPTGLAWHIEVEAPYRAAVTYTPAYVALAFAFYGRFEW